MGWPRSEGARSRAAAGEPEAARNEAAGAPREGLSWRDSCRPHQPAGRIPACLRAVHAACSNSERSRKAQMPAGARRTLEGVGWLWDI